MRKVLYISCLLLFYSVTTTFAASVTFDFGCASILLTPTARQEVSFLMSLLVQENALRAAQRPPAVALTLEQYVRDIFLAPLKGYGQQAEQLDRSTACARFKGLTGVYVPMPTLPPELETRILAPAEWGEQSPCP